MKRDAQIELLRRFRAGDESAFRQLLERYGDTLAHRVRRTLPQAIQRRVTVQDVLQEACLAAFEGRERFASEEVAGFRRWLLGIVDNKVRDAVRFHAGTARRSMRQEVTRSKRPDTKALRGRSPTPSSMAVGQETRDRIRRALDALPPDYREVIRLTRREHLGLRQAAERLDRSYEATKKLYARAMARLRAILEDEEGTHGR